MRVRDLGALIVEVDGVERPVGGSKAAALLAFLVINANQRVSIQALMDVAWGDAVTAGTASTLESHVWRLRQLLEPNRGIRQPSSVLVNEAGGYRLIANGHSVDSLLFEQMAGDVHQLLTVGRAAQAVTRAEDALALWRGHPYGALGEHVWAQPAVARLTELRGQVDERRVDALLAAGHVDRALADLEPLIAAAPFREHLRAQQMLALYRSGRIEQALNVFQLARNVLIQEIGTEPGPELLALHRKILDHDDSLRALPVVGDSVRPVEVRLPAALDALVGRDDELDEVTALVRRDRLVTIVGAAGCGKTRLAIDVARRAAGDFPDGVWFVDLSAVTDADLVVDAVMSTIGISASTAATPLEDLAHYLRDRQLLMVLDNCEHTLTAVAHIIEATLGQVQDFVNCRILATSREPIDVAGETTWTLQPLLFGANVSQLVLDSPSNALVTPAVQLFLRRLRSVTPSLPIDATVINRADAICTAVDGLPLAIELAAARARSYSLGDIEAQVSDDPGGLRRLGRTGATPDHRATMQSTIEWSHRLLSPSEQLLHRRLAVLPGPFTRDAAAAVATDMSIDEVGDLLAQLVHRSMLTSTASETGGAGGRTSFSQLATVRSHARHALSAAGEMVQTTARRNVWTADLIANRPRLGSPAEVAWFHALDQNYATVRATLADELIEQPNSRGCRLAPPLAFYWYYRAQVVEAGRWLQLARNVAGDDDTTERVVTAIALASALAVQGRVDAARPHVTPAIRDIPLVPADRLVEVGEALVTLASAVWVHEVRDLVADVNAALTAVARRADDAELGILVETCSCMATAAAGHLDEAAHRAEVIYQRAEAMDNHTACMIAAAAPLTAALRHAQPSRGIPWVGRVMRAHLRVGSASAGMFIETRANYEAQLGQPLLAVRLYAAARTQTRRAAMVWPRQALTHQMLTETRIRLGATSYEEAWKQGEELSLAEIAALN